MGTPQADLLEAQDPAVHPEAQDPAVHLDRLLLLLQVDILIPLFRPPPLTGQMARSSSTTGSFTTFCFSCWRASLSSLGSPRFSAAH